MYIFKSFNEYFSAEHSRLLSLWRAVVAFRRQFGEMKTATERDMSHLRSDITRASRSMHSACLNLSANMRNTDTQTQVNMYIPCSKVMLTHLLQTVKGNYIAVVWHDITFCNKYRDQNIPMAFPSKVHE